MDLDSSDEELEVLEAELTHLKLAPPLAPQVGARSARSAGDFRSVGLGGLS